MILSVYTNIVLIMRFKLILITQELALIHTGIVSVF